MGKVQYTVVTTYYKLIRKLRSAGIEPSPQALRTAADTFATLYPMPMNTRLEMIQLGGRPCGLVSHRIPKTNDVFVFIHGGGFAFGSVRTHRVAIAHLCKMTGMRGYIPEYRLTPEHPYPAALNDIESAWNDLLKTFPSHAIHLMGDSAGGNLAAALVHRLKDKGRRLPASLILMSPWLDLAPDSASALKNRDQDSLFDKNDLIHYSRFYIGDSNYRDPDLSPLRADVGGFPPTLLQVAENELLYFDSLAMIEKLKDAGVEHEVIVEQNLFHSWQLFPDFIPEAKQSLQQAANFILKVRKAALQHHEQSETAHVESTSASV